MDILDEIKNAVASRENVPVEQIQLESGLTWEDFAYGWMCIVSVGKKLFEATFFKATKSVFIEKL